jgi:hypothetical protein
MAFLRPGKFAQLPILLTATMPIENLAELPGFAVPVIENTITALAR